jgi:hypothetical protein
MTLKLKIALAFLSTVAFLSLITWQRKRFPKPMEKALETLRVWWLGIAKKIGHVQTAIILTVFYFTGIAATALISRCLRHDFLRLRESGKWHVRKRKKDTIETLMRQF